MQMVTEEGAALRTCPSRLGQSEIELRDTLLVSITDSTAEDLVMYKERLPNTHIFLIPTGDLF